MDDGHISKLYAVKKLALSAVVVHKHQQQHTSVENLESGSYCYPVGFLLLRMPLHDSTIFVYSFNVELYESRLKSGTVETMQLVNFKELNINTNFFKKCTFRRREETRGEC